MHHFFGSNRQLAGEKKKDQNKITKDKTDLAPTISLGVTIDHVFSMTTPLLGGLLWAKFGYSSVFLASTSVAILSYLVAARIKYVQA